MVKVGIVGGTGYTGIELLKLLVLHPEVEVTAITSRGEAGQPVDRLYTNLRGHLDLNFVEPSLDNLSDCDVVFYATPNGIAMENVPALLEAGIKVIDMAADFRFKNPDTWKQWYGVDHTCPELLEEAVYGLPEVYREELSSARLVANPGCYPTAVQLGFLPLLEKKLIHCSPLIADAKSGVSGAGRGANVANLLCEVSESFKAYGVPGHRHLPEICQGLNRVAEQSVDLTFVPHLTPMIRGIHATLYGQLKTDVTEDLQALYEQRYANEAFVDVMPAGSHPETRSVKGSNMCRISLHRPQGGNTVVILSAIDNLVKGAAGQAVQSMNIMLGLEEGLGLPTIGMLP